VRPSPVPSTPQESGLAVPTIHTTYHTRTLLSRAVFGMKAYFEPNVNCG
jgi:hypothetical protein